jgi:maltose alpha-D-glucosyltransferase/alpha-amylase
MVFKLYRRVAQGVHPEIEMGRHLAERTAFRNTPRVLGAIELQVTNGPPTSLGVVHEFVQNQGDAWRFTSEYVMRFLDDMALVTAEHRGDTAEHHVPYRHFAHTMGRRVAELHRALAAEIGDPDFDPEPVTEADGAAWRARFQARAMRAASHLDGNFVRTSMLPRPRISRAASRAFMAIFILARYWS